MSMVAYSLAIEFTPAALRQVVDCVPPERFPLQLSPDRFSLTEMVAHLADWETLFLDRMVLALETPGATIETYDEGARAVEKEYSTRNLQHELDVFENRRRDTLSFLKDLSDEQLSQTFIHPERGTMSIKDQLMMLLGHDIYHLEQATQYLREWI